MATSASWPPPKKGYAALRCRYEPLLHVGTCAPIASDCHWRPSIHVHARDSSVWLANPSYQHDGIYVRRQFRSTRSPQFNRSSALELFQPLKIACTLHSPAVTKNMPNCSNLTFIAKKGNSFHAFTSLYTLWLLPFPHSRLKLTKMTRKTVVQHKERQKQWQRTPYIGLTRHIQSTLNAEFTTVCST
ncbi:Uncharacterised protein [Bifidobacterium longum subsp. infantis]|uniref:Uncharacterized protein n=1 Tax=Bifidobacterium longum subsp. infantis TaxID=1682 RepID=A0A564RY68_BIFLI|nr:Uncharacterised protein [Bifidobacterium longum subsp. infantis]